MRVTRSEYELSDGSVFPIIPELLEDITVEEFQKYYDNAVEAVRSSEKVGGDNSNSAGLGQSRED